MGHVLTLITLRCSRLAVFFSWSSFGTESPVLSALIIGSSVFVGISLAMACIALVAHLKMKRKKAKYRQRKNSWRQVLLDILAEERAPVALHNRVEASQHEQLLDCLIPYATTVKGDALDTLREVARPFLSTVEQQLASQYPLKRARAIRHIGFFGGEEHASTLRDTLDDPSDIVSGIAFRHLAQRSNPNDAPRLLQAAVRHRGTDRNQIVSSLTELGERAAPFFREVLADGNSSTYQRVLCSETLRWLADGKAVPIAMKVLDNSDVDPELASALLRFMRRVGRRTHSKVIRPYIHSDVPFVRIQATRALGQLGNDSDGALLTDRVLDDPSRWVAISAAESLAELRRTEELRRLSQMSHPRASIATDLLPSDA